MKLHLTSNRSYANLGSRTVARCIDSLLLGLLWPITFLYLASSPSTVVLTVRCIVAVTFVLFPSILLHILYITELVHRFGGTVGKLILNIHVTNDRQQFLSRKIVFFREFIAKPISFFFMIGIFAILFDEQHRAWHDHLSGSVVHKKRNRIIVGIAVCILFLGIHAFLWKNVADTGMKNDSLKKDVQNLIRINRSTTPVSAPQKPLSQTLSPDAKTWLLALSGITFAQNQEGFSALQSPTSQPVLKNTLKSYWEIQNKADALQTMAWLKVVGHSEQFEQLRVALLTKTNGDQATYDKLKPLFAQSLKLENTKASSFVLDLVWEHRNDLGDKKLKAWDYGRLVGVARWSYSAGYISEDEAWKNILFAGHQIQSSYSSWQDFEANYLLGRAFWSHNTNNSDVTQGIEWMNTNPKSPWKTLPWNLEDIQKVGRTRVTSKVECTDRTCSSQVETPIFDATQTLPDDFPSDIPLYTESHVFDVGEVTSVKIVLFSTSQKGESGKDAVIQFYADYFAAHGWTKVTASSSSLEYVKSNTHILVDAKSDDDGNVKYAIQYGK